MPQEISNPGYSCHMAAKNLRELKCSVGGRDMLYIDSDGLDYEARCRKSIESGEWVGTLCIATSYSCIKVKSCNIKTTSPIEDISF